SAKSRPSSSPASYWKRFSSSAASSAADAAAVFASAGLQPKLPTMLSAGVARYASVVPSANASFNSSRWSPVGTYAPTNGRTSILPPTPPCAASGPATSPTPTTANAADSAALVTQLIWLLHRVWLSEFHARARLSALQAGRAARGRRLRAAAPRPCAPARAPPCAGATARHAGRVFRSSSVETAESSPGHTGCRGSTLLYYSVLNHMAEKKAGF